MHGEKKQNMGGKLLGESHRFLKKNEYCEMVEKAKHHIKEGDIFQIVLSNRLSAPFEGSLLIPTVLRTINPSPYMFYFFGNRCGGRWSISGDTCEAFENGVLHTFPLAGTRPRGATAGRTKSLKELLKDEKELAEHNMLVDLGRNDLGKVSKFGSVQVEKLHSIERYSHVMHIGSTVRGR